MLQIMLVANHQSDTEHLIDKLMLEEDISVVADVADFDQAVRAVCAHKIDLVLVSLSRVWYQDVEFIRDLKTIRPSMKFLVVSTERQASAALRALHAGIDGFLVRDDPVEDLVAAMRVLASGRRYVCPSVAHQIAMNLLVARPLPRRRLAS
jgi:DNA-binding NarL/FixJ family response regulator